jgi:hypothetical protein
MNKILRHDAKRMNSTSEHEVISSPPQVMETGIFPFSSQNTTEFDASWFADIQLFNDPEEIVSFI